jgi:hypothetical protein
MVFRQGGGSFFHLIGFLNDVLFVCTAFPPYLSCIYQLPLKLAPAILTSTGPGANFKGANLPASKPVFLWKKGVIFGEYSLGGQLRGGCQLDNTSWGANFMGGWYAKYHNIL